MGRISSPLLSCAQPARLALVAARRLGMSPNELENRPGYQECQSTDEKRRPGSKFAHCIRQASTIGFGEDGPYQWHFLLCICRLMVLHLTIADGRRLTRR